MEVFEHISQMDLCTIISNLLKNAVEAVDKDGEIAVHIVRKEKYVQVDIHNSCKTMPQISRMEEIKTSKADKENHGYGLDNVLFSSDLVCKANDLKCHAEISLFLPAVQASS